jgi:hypothetical protein
MANADAFGLQNSGFESFLFADVGYEINGSSLTILSMLARLGKDPWTEAASWAKLPRPALIDRLAAAIAQMPLCPQALAEARNTASRVSLLLPSESAQPAKTAQVRNNFAGAQNKLIFVMLCASVAAAIAVLFFR